MTPQIALTLTVVLIVIVLFATEKLRVDLIAMLVLLTLALSGLVTPEEAFSGFSSPAVVTVAAIYVVSGGLFKTGVADMLGQRILAIAGHTPARLTAAIMAACGSMSAFMNNIGATAVLLPAVGGISRQTRTPLSKLLIPLAFASLLGGNMTLIGTPPNILAANILAERGLPAFGFFDFTPVGLILFATGILFMVFIGRHLLPVRETVEELKATYQLREYVSEVRVLPDSPLVGMSLLESRLGADYDLTVVAAIHGGAMNTAMNRDTQLQANDLLLVKGSLDNLVSMQHILGLVLETGPSVDLSTNEDNTIIIEATLSPRSRMVGRSLKEVRFRDRYGFTALAVWRQGAIITERLRDAQLQFGDALVLHGERRHLRSLQASDHFLVLETVNLETRRQGKALIALAIMGLILLTVTLGGLDIAVGMTGGALAMVLTGCLSADEAYQSIEWKSIFLIGGMLPLGLAMESSGTAGYLAHWMIEFAGGLGAFGLLAGVYILTALITQPMSNAAATVLIVPIAIDVALDIGASPLPFVLATVIGASTSFLTPVGHQANILVFGPGGYRFSDYTRVGLPLSLVIFAVSMFVVPYFWPLFP